MSRLTRGNVVTECLQVHRDALAFQELAERPLLASDDRVDRLA